MANEAVILVPTQGDHATMFQNVAKSVRKDVYGGKATVVLTSVGENTAGEVVVSFATSDGNPFCWHCESEQSSVLTISHAAMCGGPNLASHDGGYQPWGPPDVDCDDEFPPGAKTFWASVSLSLKATGKIILVGCNMASGIYANEVARMTGRTVYAADGKFPAADSSITVKHVKAIEKGTVLSPMKRVEP